MVPELPIDENAAAENRDHVIEYFPQIKDLEIEKTWSGIMPFRIMIRFIRFTYYFQKNKTVFAFNFNKILI